eukprot:gene35022-17983_t
MVKLTKHGAIEGWEMFKEADMDWTGLKICTSWSELKNIISGRLSRSTPGFQGTAGAIWGHIIFNLFAYYRIGTTVQMEGDRVTMRAMKVKVFEQFLSSIMSDKCHPGLWRGVWHAWIRLILGKKQG